MGYEKVNYQFKSGADTFGRNDKLKNDKLETFTWVFALSKRHLHF
jgi:hypothetical protein